ncbi:MAG: T9SS type A sorting domain-containing protein [Tannerellaceae bacterium]|jgi:hypothetical protein|nr:T9SS type A sorting domain-containing protein [Tannerellaceae bacterium]
MKKLANTRLLGLLAAFLLCLSQAEARDIYVSPAGAGNGASENNPIRYAGLWYILNTYSGDNTLNVYFAGGVYDVTAPFAIFNTSIFDAKNVTFSGTGTDDNPTIFNGGGSANNQILDLTRGRSSTTAFSFTIHNIIIEDFSAVNSNSLFSISGNATAATNAAYNTITIDKVTIMSCNNTGAPLILLEVNNSVAEYAKLYISNSSIIYNNRGTSRLIYLHRGTAYVYNNTISWNTCQATGGLYIVTFDTNTTYRVFNNTFYNTGDIYLYFGNAGTNRVMIINNIVTGASSIRGDISNSNCIRNIFGTTFYLQNNSSGTVCQTFAQDFSPVLKNSNTPGTQVHQLTNVSNLSHSIAKQGRTSAVTNAISGAGINFTGDQLGFSRPANGEIALGAVEPHIVARDTTITVTYSNRLGTLPQPVTVDLSSLLVEVPAAAGAVSYSLPGGVMIPLGTLSLSGAQLVFTPATGVSGGRNTFPYRVEGGAYAATGYVTILLQSSSDDPPGYTDPSDFNTCFAYMGAVNFSSDYRFIVDGGSRRLVGFSIPYVADLNHDGYPEVIGIGKTDNDVSLHGYFRYVYIYNGRTGAEIVRLPFINSSGNEIYFNTSGGYHVTPSVAALVDSDRDGIVEIIVAFPRDGSGTNNEEYVSRVVSYKIVPVGNSYTLLYNWRAGEKYTRNVAAGSNASDEFQRANPQICDLDGDGTPEVLVYNKVYNAVNGALLLELETMGTGTTEYTWPTTAYMGCSVNAPGGEYHRDRYQAFPYIYDMDGDGTYDIVAGGKIYKIKKTGNIFGYDIISMPGVGDGYTGVADITGDGTADIVVVSRAGTSSTSNIEVKVWNPKFNSHGVANPTLIASRNIAVTSALAGTGSNSYVYIGDIDGREQEINGKKYRLPEIAILTGTISTTVADFPRHPNISTIPEGDAIGQGGIPTSMTSGRGALFALTYDVAGGDLKGSFILEHEDTSINTGFTLFDFDNDGVMEICYRDMQTLRIIKPVIPYVKAVYTDSGSSTSNYNKPDVILFKKSCQSYTGFEYPVIADIDNDASAEMVVVGHQAGASAHGYIYALGNGSGDKFAPALPVWNQFMYDPFKINPDLTTPVGPAVNRLDTAYTFRRKIKDENNHVIKTIDEYRPFNGTLTQAPNFMGIGTIPGAYPELEPIVFLTEAYIADNDDPDLAKRPKIEKTGTNPTYIYITIGNRATAKTDISANTPILIYTKNKVSKENAVPQKYILASLQYEISPNTFALFGSNTISAGMEFRFRIALPTGFDDPNDIYIVRLADDSDTSSTPPVWRWGENDNPALANANQGIGVARRQFRDCDWNDQWVRVSRYQTIDDAQTVQEFHSVVIDIWDNDILPAAFFANLQIPTDSVAILIPPKAGYLTCSGRGRDSRIEYHHDGRIPLPNAVDSFRYEVKFWDVTTNPHTRRTGASTVYIYILESGTGGFSACYGSQVTITLANKPQNLVSFNWFDETGHDHIGSGLSRTLNGVITGDSIYQIQPRINPDPYNVEFPKGLLTISIATNNTGNITMRWTGALNQDWKNIYNWVEVKNGFEMPARMAPTGCVDVIIPSGVKNYPELASAVTCHDIKLEDRAMIAGINHLTYRNAKVELKLNPVDKDRFVMWSAPLQSVYSGDYHYTDGTQPVWGDVFMNLFQHANPDWVSPTSPAVPNMFTATFGSLETALPLGKAFNLRVTATRMNKDSVFTFPQTATHYTYADQPGHTTPTLPRLNGSRFITESASWTGNGDTFDLPVYGGDVGNTLVQVVNPFMAYLDISSFLSYPANSSVIGSTYKIWNGLVNEGIIDIYIGNPTGKEGQKLIVNGNIPTGSHLTLIPPLQSFFVEKSSSTLVTTLTMSSAWTTTKGNTPYSLLRSDAQPEESNLLRIKATQGGCTGTALLCFDENASPAYRGTEDSHKLFYSEIPLSVYSFTPSKEPLAINMNGNYTNNTGLGLMTTKEGEVRLDFSGMATFGHNVYLIDYDRNGKVVETDLQKTPYYTFMAVKKSTDDAVIELNDRFALRMERNPTDNAVATGESPGWNVSEKNGIIHVRSTQAMSSLQVYNVSGALVYQTNKQSTSYEVRADRQQVYIVKAKIGEAYHVQKIVVP